MSIRDKIKPTDLCKRTVILSSADLKPPPKRWEDMTEEERAEVICWLTIRELFEEARREMNE